MELITYKLILTLKCFIIVSLIMIVASFVMPTIYVIAMMSINVAEKILNIISYKIDIKFKKYDNYIKRKRK